MSWQDFKASITSCIVAVCLILSGCSKKEPPLVVLTSGDNEPFVTKNEKGEFVGFDIDIIRKFAASINRELEIKLMPFDELVEAIQTRRGDIAIGGLSITDERKERVAFSPKYRDCGYSLVMLGSSPNDLKDFNGEMIGVRANTCQEQVLKNACLPIPNVFVRSYTPFSSDIMVEKLHSGEIKAVAVNDDTAKCLVDKNPDLKMSPIVGAGSQSLGFMVDKNSILLDQLKDFFEKQADALGKLTREYFSAGSSVKN